MNRDLKKLLDFVRFTHEVREVQRTIHFERDDHTENDAEHGYQVAITAWFLIEDRKLKLDKHKVVAMALLHDTIEVYAGDVSAHLPEHRHPNRKKSEEQAVKKLVKRWPTFKSLKSTIHEYELQKSAEARFVYALDKLMPILNIYLYGGRSWQLMNIGYDDVVEIKKDKFDKVPEVKKTYEEFMKMIEKQPKYFGHKDRIVYNKLVRDKIPAVVKASGKTAKTRSLKKRQYRQELIKKLQEEAKEFANKPSIDELADLDELLIALREDMGITAAKLEKVRKQKATERGRFKKKLFLESVE